MLLGPAPEGGCSGYLGTCVLALLVSPGSPLRRFALGYPTLSVSSVEEEKVIRNLMRQAQSTITFFSINKRRDLCFLPFVSFLLFQNER